MSIHWWVVGETFYSKMSISPWPSSSIRYNDPKSGVVVETFYSLIPFKTQNIVGPFQKTFKKKIFFPQLKH